MNPQELISSLLDSLSDFEAAHREAEAAHVKWLHYDEHLSAARTTLKEQIADEVDEKGKPKFSNDDKRRAELERRIKANHGYLYDLHWDAQLKRDASQAEVARLQEALKTYRAVLHYRTAEADLETARLEASTIAETVQSLASVAEKVSAFEARLLQPDSSAPEPVSPPALELEEVEIPF